MKERKRTMGKTTLPKIELNRVYYIKEVKTNNHVAYLSQFNGTVVKCEKAFGEIIKMHVAIYGECEIEFKRVDNKKNSTYDLIISYDSETRTIIRLGTASQAFKSLIMKGVAIND